MENPQEQDEKFFKGTVNRVAYRNEETGFGVVRAEPLTGGLETVVGIVPTTLREGSTFIARGSWQTHHRFGRQFRASSVVETEPTSRDAILRYLGSGVIKGIGPKLAERIVDHFGEETLEIIDRDPARLRAIAGIGMKKFGEITAAWEEKRVSREVLLFFQNYGISASLAQRILKAYGARAVEVVSDNPYILCDEVWGIGFHTADLIASQLGVAPNSTQRARAGLLYVLRSAADDGHTFLPLESAGTRLAQLLAVTETEELARAIELTVGERLVIAEEGRLYAPYLYAAEKTLAQCIAQSLKDQPLREIADKLTWSVCNEPLRAGDGSIVRLSNRQREAVQLTASKSLVVITGGPGCGKTTVVRAIATLFRRAGLRVRLAAPTGRAAQRLAEVCTIEASTIHRLLRYDPLERAFFHDEEQPLDLDVLIVDESSMIDVTLAASLFRAVPLGARVVIVGDADQLPSVGPGLFLADLLSLDQVPRVRLTELFRRSDESSITALAHAVNAGEVPDVPHPDGVTKSDTYFLVASEVSHAAALVEKLVVDQMPKKFGFAHDDITVLTPMNQGELGSIALNRRLQARLVNTAGAHGSVRVGELEFRLGDRVCQRVNNYNLGTTGVFNGDQGKVIGIDAAQRKVYVRLWDGREVEYTSETLPQLDLAYALSIHRSQGSEVPAILLVLHDGHSIMLERQLLYTAVTRAKKLLVIVGTKRALVLATKRLRSKSRHSTLPERVKALVE